MVHGQHDGPAAGRIEDPRQAVLHSPVEELLPFRKNAFDLLRDPMW